MKSFEDLVATVSVPKEAEANSFVLHAPLELLARWTLLHRVDEARRAQARDRLDSLASTYEESGDPLEPGPAQHFANVADALQTLVDALGGGDLDAVDGAAAWLADRATARDLTPLAPVILEGLAAAAHAPIFLHLLPRVA